MVWQCIWNYYRTYMTIEVISIKMSNHSIFPSEYHPTSRWLLHQVRPGEVRYLPPPFVVREILGKTCKHHRNTMSLPIPSMYGIFPYIWLVYMVNVGKYTIHGWYGLCCFLSLFLGWWWISAILGGWILKWFYCCWSVFFWNVATLLTL